MATTCSRWLGLTAAAITIACQASADLADLRRAGSLRVLTAVNSVFFKIDDAERPGFDAELLASFGERHGLTLKAIRADWNELLPSLAAGKGDVIAGGFSDTPERRRAAAFTREVFPTRNVVVTRKPTPVVTTLDELLRERIGTVRGSSMLDALLAARVPAKRIDDSLKPGGQVTALVSGKVSAVVMGVENAIAEQRRDGALQLGLFLGPPASLAYGVRRDDVELLRALDAYIDNARKSSVWSRLVVKYFGDAALDVLKKARAE
jgi:ABC-type amino acid transport substrate-binding protein